jgi:hypothetical protein
VTAPDHDHDDDSVLARFTQALPTPIRHRFRHTPATIAALHRLTDAGADPETLAAAVAAGLTHRPTRDVQALIRHRLLRRVDQLTEREG